MYRTIDPELWRDPKVKALDCNGKLLWVYLLTNEHTHLSGLYYLPIPYIIHETGLTDKGLRGGLEALEQSQMVHYDHKIEAVWVRKMLRRQRGVNAANKNAWTSIVNQLKSFKDSPLIPLFLNEYKDLGIPFEAPEQPLNKGLSEGLSPSIDTSPSTDTFSGGGMQGGIRSKPSEPSESFLKFWESYPHSRRTGKPQCVKVWKTKGLDSMIETILTALENHKASNDWQKEGGRYIPGSAVWLNQERWEQQLLSVSESVRSNRNPLIPFQNEG
jgi:hypothetical protein